MTLPNQEFRRPCQVQGDQLTARVVGVCETVRHATPLLLKLHIVKSAGGS